MTTPRFAWAGLLLPALAWAASTQLGTALVPSDCAHGVRAETWFAAALGAVALAATIWSGRAWRALQPEQATARFVAALSTLLGALFVLVIAVQGAAGLFLGCQQ